MKLWFLFCCVIVSSSTVFSANIDIVPQTGHLSDILAVAFNAESTLIASGDRDGTIILWDKESRQQIKKFNRHSNGIHKLVFSPDGKYLVSGGYDNLTIMWDINSGASKVICKNLYYVNDVLFHPSGNFIFITSGEKALHIYNWENDELETVVHHTDLSAMSLNSDGSILFVGDYYGVVHQVNFSETGNNKLTKIYDAQSYIVALEFDDSEQLLAISSTRDFNSEDEEDYSGIIEFYNISKNRLTNVQYRNEGVLGCNNYSIRSIGKGWFLALDEHGVLEKINATKSKIELLNLGIKNEKFEIIDISRFGDYLILPDGNKFSFVEMSNTQIMYDFTGTCTGILNVLNYSDSKLTVQYDHGISQWDMTTGRLKALNNANYLPNITSKHIIVSSDQRYQVKEDQFYNFTEVYRVNQMSNMSIILGDGPRIVNVRFSPSNKKIAAVDEQHNVFVYDLDSMKKLIQYKVSSSKIPSAEDYKLIFSPDETELTVLSDQLSVFKLYEFSESWKFDIDRKGNHSLLTASYSSDGKILLVAEHSLAEYYELPKNTEEYDVTVIPAGMIRDDTTYMVSRPGKFSFFNCEETSVIKTLSLSRNESGLYPDVSASYITRNSSVIQLGLTDGRLLSIDLATGKSQEIQIGSWEVLDIRPAGPNTVRLIVSNRAGVYLYDPSENKVIATLLAMKSGGYSVISSNGYYLRSKNGYESMAIKKADHIYKAEQFDVQFNRPDLVLKDIGLAKPMLLDLYKSAYKKQLLYSDQLNDVELPSVEILNKYKIDYLINKQSLKLKVKASSKEKIERLQVYVNGTPTVYGSKGYELNNATTEITKKIEIPLKYGGNVIEISAQNENGSWSLRESIKVKCTVQKELRKMMIIAVSVSQYLDTTYNLKYAVKDGKEFTEVWKKDGRKTLGYPGHFDEVEVVQLFNENATRENILALRSRIKELSSNDLVLFYVSGHGLLDEDQNFYFATHDVDFSNPRIRGISFTDLERLLDNTAVQNKAMFLDACHSGLSDTRDKNKKVDYIDESSYVTSYGSKGGKTKGNKITSNLAYQTMQDLFNNLNRGSGTVVISASAGNSYAYESDEWENGVFTYCLINGLKNRMADHDKDGEISINELSQYVSLEVDKLTNGGQKPNERQENLYNNFRLW